MKSVSETGRGFRGVLAGADGLLSAIWKSAISGSVPGKTSKVKILSAAASVTALTLACSLTACDNDYTLAYVYAPSETATTAGLINAYGVDNQTGYLRLLADSPIPSGGRKPVAIVATPPDPSGKLPQAVYVINHDDSTVVELTIGTDGKLYPQHTYNTTGISEGGSTSVSGSFPVALAISPAGTYLYVAYTYQPGYTNAEPGPGGITIFQINSDRSLGPVPASAATASAPASAGFPNSTIQDFPIGRAPVAIAATSGFVYVVSNDALAVNSSSTGTSTQTVNLFAFAANATSGSLSLLPGETINGGNVPSFGYPTGIAPGGVIADASATHLYVSDSSGNQVIPYALSGGVPTPIANGAVPTGNQPMSMTIDPSGTYLFVANYSSGTISEYTFGAGGIPVPSTTAASTEAGTGTTCVTVEPTHGIYVYTSGALSNSVTGLQLIPSDGMLKPIVGSPFTATTLPICAVAVPRFQ